MTTDCAAVSIYDSLKFCKGKNTFPGIRPMVFFIPKSQIVKWPTLPDVDSKDASMESIACYDGDFVLAADAVFKTMDIISTASNVTSAPQGEGASKSFLNSSTLKYAGTDEAATGFCRMANVDDLVFVVQQRDGKFRVIGNEMMETNTNPSQDSGMNVTDAAGTTLEISVSDVCPAPFFKGKLRTSKGILDCATGLFEEAAA